MAFFLGVETVNLFIFSDESGVFDSNHNDYFVFGGLVCFSKDEKDNMTRKYSSVENMIRVNGNYSKDCELKASNITNKEKGKIFRSLNGAYKFCFIVNQKDIDQNIFENKKHKQRYLDYVYKMGLKRLLEMLVNKKIINADEIENIYVRADEHTTATDGRYELKENLLNEFKYGTFNFNWRRYFPPIFPQMKDVLVNFCNSKDVYLIRAADIIANHFYYILTTNNGKVTKQKNTFIFSLPANRIISDGLEYFSEKLQEVN